MILNLKKVILCKTNQFCVCVCDFFSARNQKKKFSFSPHFFLIVHYSSFIIKPSPVNSKKMFLNRASSMRSKSPMRRKKKKNNKFKPSSSSSFSIIVSLSQYNDCHCCYKFHSYSCLLQSNHFSLDNWTTTKNKPENQNILFHKS